MTVQFDTSATAGDLGSGTTTTATATLAATGSYRALVAGAFHSDGYPTSFAPGLGGSVSTLRSLSGVAGYLRIYLVENPPTSSTNYTALWAGPGIQGLQLISVKSSVGPIIVRDHDETVDDTASSSSVTTPSIDSAVEDLIAGFCAQANNSNPADPAPNSSESFEEEDTNASYYGMAAFTKAGASPTVTASVQDGGADTAYWLIAALSFQETEASGGSSIAPISNYYHAVGGMR